MQTVKHPERMSYKRKHMAMYANNFYLRPNLKREFISMLEHGRIVNDSQAVEFIDDNGEWLE